MGMQEDLAALAAEVRGARERLTAMADRATALLERLQKDGPMIISLDRLAAERRVPPAAAAPAPREKRWEGEEVTALDAWEISLINEEGK